MIDSAGQSVKLVIRRLRCDKCRRIHHELPDCVVPYKRHCSETIEKIISGSTVDIPCERRVIKRIKAWWSSVFSYFMSVLASLTEKYNIGFNDPPAFCETVRAAVNSNNWIFAVRVCTRSA